MKSFFCFTLSSHKVDVADDDDDDTHMNSINRFSYEEIKKLSRNFATQIGSGGFSTVYLARLPDSGLAAIKLQSACTERLARIHDQELQILIRIKHTNIVRLLGYSDDSEEERALVFEYAPNGTLHDKLLQHQLPWRTRCLIAFQLASALEYLHGMHIIHGDIKASNILLDQNLNCKLCDFGSAKLGFTSMVLLPSSTKMNRMIIMGSQGYVDPHYLKTGLVSKKNDIYSFGVVLLELITGREAFSLERGEKLTEMIGTVEEMVDQRLNGLDLEEVKAMVSIAGKCIACSPMDRPCATQIIAYMRDKFQSLSSHVIN